MHRSENNPKKQNNKTKPKIMPEQKEKPKLKKIDQVIEAAWKELTLDVPRRTSPNSSDIKGLRNLMTFIMFVMAVCKLIFGLAYFDECPTNDWLPIYMVVNAVLQFGFLVILVLKSLQRTLLLVLFGGASLTWNFISSVNIFVEWEPDYFKGGMRYCHQGFFYFTFFSSIADYLIMVMLTCYSCSVFSFIEPKEHVEDLME